MVSKLQKKAQKTTRWNIQEYTTIKWKIQEITITTNKRYNNSQ